MQSRLVAVVFTSTDTSFADTSFTDTSFTDTSFTDVSVDIESDALSFAVSHFAKAISVLDQITSVCEIDERGAYFFPVRGPAKYFGGEQTLAHHVYKEISCALPTLQCGVGIGDSRLIARLAAISSCGIRAPVVTPIATGKSLVAGLSVSALHEHCGIDNDLVSLFRRLGLYRFSDLADIGETALIDRFGAIGKNIYRLAVGDEVEFFSPVDAGNPVVVLCDLDNQSQHNLNEAFNDVRIVMSMLKSSIYEFINTLRWNGMECLRMRICCETEDGSVNDRIWYNSDGFDAVSVHERLQWQITHWINNVQESDNTVSCIAKVSLEALNCRTFQAQQDTLWGGRSETTEQVVRSLSRVAAIDDAILITVPQWRGGRDVGTFIARTWETVDLFDDNQSMQRVQKKHWNGAMPAPRPIRLCETPQHVEVFDALLNPVVVTARHELSHMPATVIDQHGHRWDVLTWAGPWPIEERWWDSQRRKRHARVQVLVQKHGSVDQGQVWLLSTQSRQWYIVGLYH